MKKISILFLSTLLFFFTGCEEKKESQTPAKQNSKSPLTIDETNQSNATVHADKNESKIQEKYSFLVSDIADNKHVIQIENKSIEISGVSQKIILLNFFSTWCAPCKGQLPYLGDLQKKYEGELFIAGLLLNDNPDNAQLSTFLSKYKVNYFISNAVQNDALAALAIEKLQLDKDFSLPLTILFKEGHYYSHYEGAVPVEMLEHDIKNAMNKE